MAESCSEQEQAYEDSYSEKSEDEEESSEEEDLAFVVLDELKDKVDVGESLNNTQVPFDSFLYEICNPKEDTNPTEIEEDKERIREDGTGDFVDNWDDESDEDGGETELVYGHHDPKTKWNKMRPCISERYGSFEELRFCLTNYAVANGYPLRVTKSSKERLQVKCGTTSKGDSCPFKLWASWMNKERSVQIKGLNENHTCIREFKLGTLVNPNWIAKHLLKDLCRKPKIKCRELKEEVQQKFLCEVSTGQCYRAKKIAMELINGKLVDHYGRVWDYAHEVIRSNPGSTAKVGVSVNPDGVTYFHRIYICFKALKDGWSRGCRRIIGLDGCFLKGQCKGELLTAIGRDGENQVFPIAWAVVDVENKSNWKWFIELLAEDLHLGTGGGLSIISDQHKGLVEAVKEVLPMVEHRQCARHVFANFKKSYNGVEYTRYFWAAATATTQQGFLDAMELLKAFNSKAYDYLMARTPHTWSRAFYSDGKACEACENGVSESFNSVILEARPKPLLTLLEEIRIYVMKKFWIMSREHEKWDSDVCPTQMNKLKVWCKDMRFWSVLASETNLFEVRMGFEAYQVDLDAHLCTCRLWEVSGLPCVHACAAISFTNKQRENFLHPYFSKAMFVETYKGNIRPLNGSSMWPRTTFTKPLPPIARRMPGRPKLKRSRHISEGKGGYHKVRPKGNEKVCQNCFQAGHNKRSCKNPTKPAPPKEKKKTGRPADVPAKKKKSTAPPPKKPATEMPIRNHGIKIVESGTMGQGSGGKHGTKKASQPSTSIKGKKKVGEEVAPTCVQESQTMSFGKDFGENEDVGLHNVHCNYGFGDSTSKDLAASGYGEDEIYECMNQPLEIPVQQVYTQEDPFQGTEFGEEGPDDSQAVKVQLVPETQPPKAKQVVKKRGRSERIAKQKLSQRKAGPGSSLEDPHTLY